jgi:hypothetical protein
MTMTLPTLLIITGQCRSGTSAAAQVVNRLGVPAATTLAAPHGICGHRFDWEDVETTRVLLRWIQFGCRPSSEPGLANALREDLARRWFSACGLANLAGQDQPKVIACKSPLFALAFEDVLMAAKGLFDVEVLSMNRKQSEIDDSVDRTYWSDPMKRAVKVTNDLIEDALGRIEAWQVDYHELVRDPEKVTRGIASMLNVEWCEESAALIRRSEPIKGRV